MWILACIVVLVCLKVDAQEEARLTHQRIVNDNEITLVCRDENFSPFPNADFWLNETSMPLESLLSEFDDQAETGRFIFTLTQELEGFFFCGRIDGSITSDPLGLVGESSMIPPNNLQLSWKPLT